MLYWWHSNYPQSTLFLFFPPIKKRHFSLYIMSNPRNVLEHIVYKFPFPQGSRGLMPWATGSIFPALVLLVKFWLQLWGLGCSDKLWTFALLTTDNLPSPLLPVAVQWVWSQANLFRDDNIWRGSVFSGRSSIFQVGFFLHECRREGEKGASAGQLMGHCCQSHAGVTAAKCWHLLISGGILASSREPEKATRVDCNY